MQVTVPLASSDDVTDGAGSMRSPEFSDLEFAGTVVEVIVLPPLGRHSGAAKAAPHSC